jgi:hypothetical protein
MNSPRLVGGLLLFLLFASFAFAQGTEATVSGTVTDPSGAHVVGANMTATNVATGVTLTATTNEAGIYVFPALPPGQYRVTAEHAGFRKATITDVELAVGSHITVNLGLELGQTTETVEVTATANEVNASSASVGNVVDSRKILDLPLVGRSAYDLLNTQPGIVLTGANSVNINGASTGAVNYTTDGINTQDNLLNGAFNTNVSNTVSVDRVEEFRVVTSPADAEYGRGSGQVQLITRGGTNAFHGSAWEELRNTDLNANDWFNNQAGTNPITGQQQSPRNILIRNQYGLRFGGPAKKGKTFFNGIWDNDHQNQRVAQNSVVYTPTALQGQFRFFPGVVNANASAPTPVVSTAGVPIQPANATGPLQAVSIFGKDPNRPTPDSTGTISHLFGLMPAPNNYLVGDGLNTAGFLWARPVIDDFELYEGRVDHIFNEKHRITITLDHQAYTSINVANAQPFPASPVGLAPTETTQYSAAFTSSLRPNLLNEFRMGVFRPRVLVFNEYDPAAGPSGAAGLKLLPTSNGFPYTLTFAGAETNPISPAGSSTGTTSNRITQNWQYGDDLTWIKGRHSFKGGFQIRFIGNEGFDTTGVVPTAAVGAGAVSSQGITTIAGIGSNSTAANNLLYDLTGSLSTATATLNSPGGAHPTYIPGESRYSDLLTREWNGYFKDDFKVTSSLTLNLGVRYEWYGVPYDGQGRLQTLAGGGAGVFGISGTNFGALFNPGASSGSLTQVQLIGPGTPNPGTKLYNNDNNNFGPAVGLAWSLPGGDRWNWLTGGKDKTVIRIGYGIFYERNQIYLAHMANSYEPDGLATILTQSSGSLLTIGNLQLPLTTPNAPLFTEPLNGLRQQAAYAFANNLTNPYVQNYNVSIQRALGRSTSITVAFVGSAGAKLDRAYDVNEVNILAKAPNGESFLQAFNTVVKGGDSPLMDSLLAPIGVNSTTMRSVSLFQSYLYGNNPAGLAALLNGSALTQAVAPTAPGGALLAKAGLPANFFVVNPQFAPFPLGSSADAFGGAYITDNSGHSTYDSLQVQVNHRFSHGLTFQGSYVFSKALGDGNAGESATYFADYRTLYNKGLDKQLLGFNHASVYKANGLYELPFGPNKPFLKSTNGILSRIVGGWQMGGIFTAFTGAPITFVGSNGLNTSFSQGTFLSTATEVGPIPSSIQKVGNGVLYFPNVVQIKDPQVAGMAANLAALSTLRAIANTSGTPLLINSTPGQLGSLAAGSLNGPGLWRLDMNLLKRIRITERFTFQIGATAENISNTPQFSAPSAANMNVNSASFGRITSTFAPSGATSYRVIVLQARLNF